MIWVKGVGGDINPFWNFSKIQDFCPDQFLNVTFFWFSCIKLLSCEDALLLLHRTPPSKRSGWEKGMTEKIKNYDYWTETLILLTTKENKLKPPYLERHEWVEKKWWCLFFETISGIFFPFLKENSPCNFPSRWECSAFRLWSLCSYQTGPTMRQQEVVQPLHLPCRKPPDVVQTHEVDELVSRTTKRFGTDWQSLWN